MKYTRKPEMIEAVQFKVIEEIPCKHGIHKEYNDEEISQLLNRVFNIHFLPSPTVKSGIPVVAFDSGYGRRQQADLGDWIVKKPDGDIIVLSDLYFKSVYMEVSE